VYDRRAAPDGDETVIHLTRLGRGETFLLNPDLFERIDSHVDTVVRLTNGNEYVVSESPAQIIERIGLFRAQVLAAVPLITKPFEDGGIDVEPVMARRADGRHRELGSGSDPVAADPAAAGPAAHGSEETR
jgi:uncharacterized protein YlzI (FlbEa/FlbD family)